MLRETKKMGVGGGGGGSTYGKTLFNTHSKRCTANTNQHQEVGTKFKSMGVYF